MDAEKFNFVQAKHFYLDAPKQPAGTCFVLHDDFTMVTERLEDEWKSNQALMKLLADEKHKSEALAEKLRETELRLRMYGGHTANCAYHLSHYKGPVSQCDCMWTDLVPTVFAAQRPGDANG